VQKKTQNKRKRRANRLTTSVGVNALRTNGVMHLNDFVYVLQYVDLKSAY